MTVDWPPSEAEGMEKATMASYVTVTVPTTEALSPSILATVPPTVMVERATVLRYTVLKVTVVMTSAPFAVVLSPVGYTSRTPRRTFF